MFVETTCFVTLIVLHNIICNAESVLCAFYAQCTVYFVYNVFGACSILLTLC